MDFQKTVAYFTLEAAIHPSLRTYAGGQGYLTGSFARAAQRLGIPVVIVTILWRKGYYDQILGPSGMDVRYVDRYYEDILEDTRTRAKVQIGGNPNVLVKASRLKPGVFGEDLPPILFLDTDIPENDPESRANTQFLYPDDNGQRMAQEIILGIGGVRILQALGIPFGIGHLNEDYSFLAAIELIRQKVAMGLDFQMAFNQTKEQIVFTTHSPRLSGWRNLEVMIKMGCFPGLSHEQVIFLGGYPYNQTAASLRTAKRANAVSQLHWEAANRLWAWVNGRCEIVPITNGVDVPYWEESEFRGEKTLDEIPELKLKHKRFLIEENKKRTGKDFEEDVFTFVWARRFDDYKRPALIFRDYVWLGRLLKGLLNLGKAQLIVAGKPHPNDFPMKKVWNEIWERSKEEANLSIWTEYDLETSRILKKGADAWLNTPRLAWEACGTSGMSAALYYTLNISGLDGWVVEGLTPEIAFLFGVDRPYQHEWEQDAKDFEGLQGAMQLAMSVFYGDRVRWYKMAQEAKKVVRKKFSAERMVRDYVSQLYAI